MSIDSQTSIRKLKSSTHPEKETIDLLEIKYLPPEENDNFFKNMIGNKEIVKYFTQLLKVFKSVDGLEMLGDAFQPAFFLLGPDGIGKALTVYCFAKEMELPIIVIDTEKLMQDFSNKIFMRLKSLINTGRCVVLFKDVSYAALNLTEEKKVQFFSKICNLVNSCEEYSFFFASASFTANYPSFWTSAEGFNNVLTYNLPNPKERELLIKKFLRNIPHQSNLDIPKIARDFAGSSGGFIADILKKSYIQCIIDGKKRLDYKIINSTLYSENFGSEVKKMTEKEMRLTAYHEAGHVIAGYYGTPDYKISKVECVFRSESLGLTEPETDEDKLSNTREDIIGRIVHALGGKCAEQIIFNTSTSGVLSDLASATIYADTYVKAFGMDPTFGPVCVQEEIFVSETLSSIADIKVQELLMKLENQTTTILLEHKDKLIALAEELIKKETLYKEEVMEILEGKPEEKKKTTKEVVKKSSSTTPKKSRAKKAEATSD